MEEGHLMPDHVHMMLSIPPKYAVSQVVGFIKGKSAIHLRLRYAARPSSVCSFVAMAAVCGFFVACLSGCHRHTLPVVF